MNKMVNTQCRTTQHQAARTSLIELQRLFSKRHSWIFAIMLLFLIVILISSSLSLLIISEPLGNIVAHEDFLLNDLKPSVQQGKELTAQQELQLENVGVHLTTLVRLAFVAMFVFIILYSFFRSLRSVLLWKAVFAKTITLKKFLGFFAFTILIISIFFALTNLYLLTGTNPLGALVLVVVLSVLAESFLYFLEGKYFLNKNQKSIKELLTSLLLATFLTTFLWIGLFFLSVAVAAFFAFIHIALAAIMLFFLLLLLYTLRTHFLLTFTKQLFEQKKVKPHA